jgi:hypothetical protein
MVVILWIAGRKEADARVSSWYMLVNYIYIFFFFIFKNLGEKIGDSDVKNRDVDSTQKKVETRRNTRGGKH